MNAPKAVPLTAHTLVALELLASLPPAEREAVARTMRARRYAPGELVFSQNDGSSDVHFIVSGRARVTYYSGHDKEIAFRELLAGKTFGELAALDAGPRSARVEVVEESLIARIARDDFLALLARQPQIALEVMRELACTVRRLSDRVIEFSTIGVRERLHAELLRLAEGGDIASNEARIRNCPTHSALATHISTHREAVSRELSALKRAGLLRKEKGVLIITDLARLTDMVATARREHAAG